MQHLQRNFKPHLRSSFIYLANAVRDLNGNWQVFAVVLTPPAVLAALCLLPDALELERQLTQLFSPGTHSIGLHYISLSHALSFAVSSSPSSSIWLARLLHFAFLLITIGVNLLVLCILSRIRTGVREETLSKEVWAVYKRAGQLVGPFLWVSFLQALTTFIGLILLVIPGLLAYVWLYFALYAVVMDNQRSWPALIFSRELMRGCFFAVALRIVVFLAVWSGFNSWAGGAFFLISWLLGIVGVVTGFLWTGLFLVDLCAISVGYATSAFFFAAGARLYEDLNQSRQSSIPSGARIDFQPGGQPAGDSTQPLALKPGT